MNISNTQSMKAPKSVSATRTRRFCLLQHIPSDLNPDKLLPKETVARLARMIMMRQAPRRERSMEVLCEWIDQGDRELTVREVACMEENLFTGYLKFALKMNLAWMRSPAGACPTNPRAIAGTVIKLFKAQLSGG